MKNKQNTKIAKIMINGNILKYFITVIKHNNKNNKNKDIACIMYES